MLLSDLEYTPPQNAGFVLITSMMIDYYFNTAKDDSDNKSIFEIECECVHAGHKDLYIGLLLLCYYDRTPQKVSARQNHSILK